jgi:hypothetical protein
MPNWRLRLRAVFVRNIDSAIFKLRFLKHVVKSKGKNLENTLIALEGFT